MRKIEPRHGLEVYVSAKCNVVIQQDTDLGENLVVVHPDDVPKLIKFLQDAHKESLNCEPETEESESEDE